MSENAIPLAEISALSVHDIVAFGTPVLVLLALGLWHTLLYSTITPALLSLQKAQYKDVPLSDFAKTYFANELNAFQ